MYVPNNPEVYQELRDGGEERVGERERGKNNDCEDLILRFG